jgi:hypothetical protein
MRSWTSYRFGGAGPNGARALSLFGRSFFELVSGGAAGG